MKNIGRKLSGTDKKSFKKERVVNHISNSVEKLDKIWSKQYPLKLKAGRLLHPQMKTILVK